MGTKTAYETATLAGACAEALSDETEAMADALRRGDVVGALEALEALADRLQRFMTFVAIAAELGADVRVSVIAYGQRLSAVLDKVEDALERRELGRLGLVLAHGLAPVLREYEEHADDVTNALAPARAA